MDYGTLTHLGAGHRLLIDDHLNPWSASIDRTWSFQITSSYESCRPKCRRGLAQGQTHDIRYRNLHWRLGGFGVASQQHSHADAAGENLNSNGTETHSSIALAG